MRSLLAALALVAAQGISMAEAGQRGIRMACPAENECVAEVSAPADLVAVERLTAQFVHLRAGGQEAYILIVWLAYEGEDGGSHVDFWIRGEADYPPPYSPARPELWYEQDLRMLRRVQLRRWGEVLEETKPVLIRHVHD